MGVVNVKLLKKVRKLIADEPRRLMMSLWGIKYEKKFLKNADVAPCGTAACLAGWTIFAARPDVMAKLKPSRSLLRILAAEGTNPSREAARLLGMEWQDCPFDRTEWEAPEVLAWIDRQIDAASK